MDDPPQIFDPTGLTYSPSKIACNVKSLVVPITKDILLISQDTADVIAGCVGAQEHAQHILNGKHNVLVNA